MNWKPEQVVFIDDVRKHLDAVKEELQERGISFQGYLFEPSQAPFNEKIAELQLKTVPEQKKWVSDKEIQSFSPWNMEISEYVTIVMTVPESHADAVREAMGKAGAGEIGHYSYCSFSVKGTGRFRPDKGGHPFIGQPGIPETVAEERIETICHREKLESVLEAIKRAHPYEETVIDIYPVFRMGMKRAKS